MSGNPPVPTQYRYNKRMRGVLNLEHMKAIASDPNIIYKWMSATNKFFTPDTCAGVGARPTKAKFEDVAKFVYLMRKYYYPELTSTLDDEVVAIKSLCSSEPIPTLAEYFDKTYDIQVSPYKNILTTGHAVNDLQFYIAVNEGGPFFKDTDLKQWAFSANSVSVVDGNISI